jgi:hypothetical protein
MNRTVEKNLIAIISGLTGPGRCTGCTGSCACPASPAEATEDDDDAS